MRNLKVNSYCARRYFYRLKVISVLAYIGVVLGITVRETSRSKELTLPHYLILVFGIYPLSICIVWLLLVLIQSKTRCFQLFISSLERVINRIGHLRCPSKNSTFSGPHQSRGCPCLYVFQAAFNVSRNCSHLSTHRMSDLQKKNVKACETLSQLSEATNKNDLKRSISDSPDSFKKRSDIKENYPREQYLRPTKIWTFQNLPTTLSCNLGNPSASSSCHSNGTKQTEFPTQRTSTDRCLPIPLRHKTDTFYISSQKMPSAPLQSSYTSESSSFRFTTHWISFSSDRIAQTFMFQKNPFKEFYAPIKYFVCFGNRLFPYRPAVRIYTFPAFQICLLLRNLAWCGLFVWVTTLISRNSSSEPWDTTSIPPLFWYVEESFMWMITWDYLIALLAAQDILRFIFSFSSLIDLATMPVAKAFTRFIVGDSAVHYSIHFGFLRIVRLVRTDGILFHLMPWIGLAKLHLISLIIGSFVITLMFACAMFILEAPYSTDTVHYTNLNDFLFFAVVTISTVGYGDFSPHKPLTKAIVMLAIVVALAFLPTQIQKLISALQTPPRVLGRISRATKDYIVISGSIYPPQLMFMCREFSQSLGGSLVSIIVITPEPVAQYKPVIRSAFLDDSLSVAVLQMDLSCSKAHSYYRSALTVLIVGNLTCQSFAAIQNQPKQAMDVLLMKDDQKTMLRFLGAQRVCWPGIPVSVQLNDMTSCALLKKMGASNAFCLQHIKMKLMAKTCADCPGFNTLMINLFCQPPESEGVFLNYLQEAQPDSQDMSCKRLYLRGAKYQLYKLRFPECFVGLPYLFVVRFLLMYRKIYCLGLYYAARNYWLNPTGYCIGDEVRHRWTTEPFGAIVAAQSSHVVQEIAELKASDHIIKSLKLPHNLLQKSDTGQDFLILSRSTSPHEILTNQQDEFSHFTPTEKFPLTSYPLDYHVVFSQKLECLLFMNNIILAENPKKRRSSSTDQSFDSNQFQMTPNAGIHSVADLDTAKRLVFSDVTLPLVLICGYPRGIAAFIRTFLKNQKANIVLLSPHSSNDFEIGTMQHLSQCCVWIKGSALNPHDLLCAGVLQAQQCAIFSASHVSWAENISLTESDTQAILVQSLIRSLQQEKFYSDYSLTHKTDTRFSQNRVNMTRYFGQHTKMLGLIDEQSLGCGPRIFLELKSSQFLELLDDWSKPTFSQIVQPSLNTYNFSSSTAQNSLIWAENGFSFQHPAYTSGRVTLEPMLYSVISFGLSVSPHCVNSNLIDAFIDGSSDLFSGEEQFTSPTSLEHIPDAYESRPFADLFVYLITRFSRFPFALYRCVRRSLHPLNVFEVDQFFVITCPPLNTLLEKGDRVYTLKPYPMRQPDVNFSINV